MPIPWLTVLQSVPWSDVLSNAPKVADGARKLWQSIGRKSAAGEPATTAEHAAAAAETPTVATLDARLGAVEHNLAGVHEQLLASSELIKALADQNALLIRQAEALRVKLRRLTAGLLIVGIVAVGALVQTLGR